MLVTASQQYTHIDLLFLTEQSTSFVPKNQYRHTSETNSQTASYAQITTCANFYENINPKTEPLNKVQPSEYQKMFDFSKQIEELYEPYGANNSELSVTEFRRKSSSGILRCIFLLCKSAIESENIATLFN